MRLTRAFKLDVDSIEVAMREKECAEACALVPQPHIQKIERCPHHLSTYDFLR